VRNYKIAKQAAKTGLKTVLLGKIAKKALMGVAIIACIGATVMTTACGNREKGWQSRQEDAKVGSAHSQISIFGNGLYTYHLDNGCYPSTQQGLKALYRKPAVGASNWKGPYISSNEIPKTPWGSEYQYCYPGKHNTDKFDIWVDGKKNINNW
jgi:type II secretion system protein G